MKLRLAIAFVFCFVTVSTTAFAQGSGLLSLGAAVERAVMEPDQFGEPRAPRPNALVQPNIQDVSGNMKIWLTNNSRDGYEFESITGDGYGQIMAGVVIEVNFFFTVPNRLIGIPATIRTTENATLEFPLSVRTVSDGFYIQGLDDNVTLENALTGTPYKEGEVIPYFVSGSTISSFLKMKLKEGRKLQILLGNNELHFNASWVRIQRQTPPTR